MSISSKNEEKARSFQRPGLLLKAKSINRSIDSFVLTNISKINLFFCFNLKIRKFFYFIRKYLKNKIKQFSSAPSFSRRTAALNRLVVQFAFQFFAFVHFANRFHKVLVYYVVSFVSDREHSRFGTNIPEISAVESVRQLDHCFVVFLVKLKHFFRNDINLIILSITRLQT